MASIAASSELLKENYLGAAPEAELALNGCTAYVRQLYHDTTPFNGGRWMMIEVRNGEVLEDVKELIGIRMRKKRSV